MMLVSYQYILMGGGGRAAVYPHLKYLCHITVITPFPRMVSMDTSVVIGIVQMERTVNEGEEGGHN